MVPQCDVTASVVYSQIQLTLLQELIRSQIRLTLIYDQRADI